MLSGISKVSSAAANLMLLGLFYCNFFNGNSVRLTEEIDAKVIKASGSQKPSTSSVIITANQVNRLQKTIEQDILQREYNISYSADKGYHQSPNRAHNTRITYFPQRVNITPRVTEKPENEVQQENSGTKENTKVYENYLLDIDVKGYGTSEVITYPFTSCSLISQNNEAFAQDEHMRVEYINNEHGTRQNFVIQQPVAGNELAVHLTLSTTLTATIENENTIVLTGKETKLYYRDLNVWDAAGKILPAQMQLSNEGKTYKLLLAVNTTGAQYPVTIDPIVASGNLTNADWKVESNTANSYMGENVSSAGDVNGDGYNDVIVGASGRAVSFTNEGTFYVYHGSATGLSTSAARTVNGGAASRRLGSGVNKGGDINGDGYSDIIVGCQGYSNGQSNEGSVWIFYGSSSGIGSTPDVILESNIASAYMGRSLASAGDVNGDGYSDIVVGSESFSNGESSEGAFWIYQGSSSGINSTPMLFVESNQASWWMGKGVGGAGDINGDGYSDVLIGLYGYENGQTYEGGTYVYYGSSSGITSATPGTILEGNVASIRMGESVASAGDVNGDGYGDIVVGLLGYSNSQNQEGAAYIYHGSASGINTTLAAKVESNVVSANMGSDVGCAGDVNGDGYSDIIVGAYAYTNGQSQSGEGAVFIYKGSSTGINTTAISLIESNIANIGLGISCTGAGDVNGDGYSDVIAGAYFYANVQSNEGMACAFYGAASGLVSTSNVIAESNNDASSMGWSIASAGDINGDGYNDIIVGAPGYDNGEATEGAAFIYHGSATGISATATIVLESNQGAAYFGQSVSGAGDVNGDGYSDIIIGAYLYDNNQSNEGAVYIYQGSASGIVSGSPFIIESNMASTNLGWAVSGAGDVNGDGYSDVIAGAQYYANGQSNEGAAFLYYGSSSGTTTSGAVTLEPNLASTYFASAVASAGDVNGDGYSDVLVGAERYTNSETEEGAFWVYHGSATGLTTTAAVKLESNQASNHLGISVNSAGDVNGDGYSDIIVGQYAYTNVQSNEGAAFVYHGSSGGINTTPVTTLESNLASAYFGFSVNSAGDVNGDGYSDVVVGAYNYNNGESGEGAVFIYHGSSSGISTTVAMMTESNNAGWNLGRSVASAGDVNGDGYSDVIAGARSYTNVQASEGAAFVYYGNGGSTGRRNNMRLYNTDLSTPIQQSNKPNTEFGLGLYSTSPQGKQKVKMVWEVKQQGQAFSSAGGTITNSVSSTSSQGSFSNTGLTGTNLTGSVTKPAMHTKVRCRVQYDLVTSVTGQKYGPWRYPQGYLSGAHGMSSTPLPVEWLNFTAQWLTAGENAQLNWSTASEKNNSHFTILRSTDGQNWEEINTVNGAGTTNKVSTYQYIDQTLSHINASTHQQVYYCIMQTDYNGQFSLSDMRELSLTPQAGILVAPNPGSHPLLTLKQPAATDLPYTIMDMQGKAVGSGVITKGNTQQAINLQHLPAGVYFLSLDFIEKKESIKLIKQ